MFKGSNESYQGGQGTGTQCA